MKSFVQKLIKASSYEDEKTALLDSLFMEITDNKVLMEKIEGILPLLSDGDRSIRNNGMIVLEFINGKFRHIAVVNSITDMAIVKLGDSATLDNCCKIIRSNLEFLSDETLKRIIESLFAVDLRSNLLSHRLEAYALLDSIVSLNRLVVPATKDQIDSFRRFCGYEQDPRCLNLVFTIFPKFSSLILNKLDDHLRGELFDTLSVFYPITQRLELQEALCNSLSSLPYYSEEIASLVSRKLTNALSDTRSSVFYSLPKLLKYETSDNSTIDVIVSFIKSMKDFFSGGSTDCTQDAVEIGMEAIINFISLNKNTHSKISQSAISCWIPEIINSTDISTVRAYSVVAWSINNIIPFSSIALIPLGAVLSESFTQKNELKVQSVLASIAEFLKLQQRSNASNLSLGEFFSVSCSVLDSDFSENCKSAALVVIREMSNKFSIPYNAKLVSSLLMNSKNNDFSSQCLISLTTHQEYQEIVRKNIIEALEEALHSRNIPKPFASERDVIQFVSKLSVVQFFAPRFLKVLAETKKYRDLLRCILPLESLEIETVRLLFETISLNYISEMDDLVFAIALRASDELLFESINMYPNISPLLIYVAPQEAIPSDVPLTDPLTQFSYGAKFVRFPPGFIPPPTSLAFRNSFDSSFNESLIPELLRLENLLDNAVGQHFDKFEILQTRFLYDPDYKMTLWGKYYNTLDNNLFCLCKLCLLCPPDFFLSSIQRFIPLLSSFLDVDPQGALDLCIFSLVNLNGRTTITFITKMNDIIPKILSLFTSNNSRIRLDSCKVLRAMASALPAPACEAHKANVLRSLKPILDDPKREIRQEAANTRCAWIKIKE